MQYNITQELTLVLGDINSDDLSRSYTKNIPRLTRQSTFNHHNIQLLINLNNLKLPNLRPRPSHPPRHLLPFVNPPGRRPGTNRPQSTMTLGTMSHLPSLEVMPLNPSLEPFPNRRPRHVDKITFLENLIEDQLLVRLEPFNARQPELLEMPQRDHAGLLEMARLGLRQLLVADAAVPDLDGVVPVGGQGFDLGHDVAFAEPDDGYGDHGSVWLEERHHPEL